MINRLTPKRTLRVLAVQYDGTNYIEILNFCRYCHVTDNDAWFNFRGITIKINIGDWIVELGNKEYNLISENAMTYLCDNKKDIVEKETINNDNV